MAEIIKCPLCSKGIANLTRQKDGSWKWQLSDDFCEVEVLLSSGSKMVLNMCESCKNTLNGITLVSIEEKAKKAEVHEDERIFTETIDPFDKIIGSIKQGWEKEMGESDWPEEKREEYRAKFFGLSIVSVIK